MKSSGTISILHDEYELITDYRDITKYRQSLNQLVSKTFGFDFEEWYRQGYWSDQYRPYSLVYKDEIVANVSANPITFLAGGTPVSTLQIGTVMTQEPFRHRGLSRVLMERILKDYEKSCSLLYLYANDTVLDFYPRFGFNKADEYNYTRRIDKPEHKYDFRRLDFREKQAKEIITRLVAHTIPVAEYQMVGNPQLVYFYLITCLYDHVYYCEELDLAVIIEYMKDTMLLLDIYSEKAFDLNAVIDSLADSNTVKVRLGFTPLDASAFSCEKYQEKGLTFFVKGKNMISSGRFPVLSHA